MHEPSGLPLVSAGAGLQGPSLRRALLLRGWTAREFATVARVSRPCLYSALQRRRVSDLTAIRIFETLSRRQPVVVLEEPVAQSR